MLRTVPDSWPVYRLGQLVTERREKVSDKDFAPLSVTRAGIVPQLQHVAKTDDGENRKRVRSGDYVINSRSDRKGSSGLSSYDGSVSLINIVLEPRRGVHGRFLHHLLRSAAFQEEFYRFGHGIVADLWTTRFSELKGIRVALPGLEVQRAITDFLDRETARIDALIAKKERQITLQRDRARSLIWTRTTGQDRIDVKRVGTAFPWIGSVPVNWRAVRIKHVARLESGHTPSRSNDDYWSNPTIPWVSLADSAQIRQRDVLYETVHKISEQGLANSSARILPAGTVVFTRDATVGLAAVLGIDMAVSQHLVGWVCGPELRSFYLLYVIQAMEHELNRLTWGATIRTIGMPDLLNLSCPLPPVDEQNEIVARLQTELGRAHQLHRTVQTSIDRLRELRSSLITAAVTGQIDPATWGRRGEIERSLESVEAAEHARVTS